MRMYLYLQTAWDFGSANEIEGCVNNLFVIVLDSHIKAYHLCPSFSILFGAY